MSLTKLDAEHYAQVMVLFKDGLVDQSERLNRLNVFPVPDGDTGTNMASTMSSVVEALDKRDLSGGMGSLCEAISRGSLMGARGNSGVILCQILRAMCSQFCTAETLGASELAAALESASTSARAAVQRPVEGTILSIMSAAAKAATADESTFMSAVQGPEDPVPELAELVGRVSAGAVEALWLTPTQLDVLAQAGVVDAGGAGLTLLFKALQSVVAGNCELPRLELPEHVLQALENAQGPSIATRASEGPAGHADREGTGDKHGTLADLRYEVMYMLEAPDEAIPAFREAWANIGDSIVVVGSEGLFNCHIHTDDVGAAIEAGLDLGRPRQIRVTDLAEQAGEEAWVRQAGGEAETEMSGRHATRVVAVGSGEGIRRLFTSLGVSAVIAGGQTMNPSTQEVLDVLASVDAEEVVILPNNSNIVAVAKQAAAFASECDPPRKVLVVPTLGIQEGLAALVELDPMASGEENAEKMAQAAARIRAGEVTTAVRASSSGAGVIEPGDFIGIARDGGIVVVGAELFEVVTDLIKKLVIEGESEIVTLIEGDGSSERVSRLISDWMSTTYPQLQLERLRGGQPLYPYLVSIE